MSIQQAYNSVQYIGEIRQFPYDFTPVGWLECNGQSLSTSEHEVLYSLLGNNYGGDSNNFNLPDLRPKDENNELINLNIGQIYNGFPYMKMFISTTGVYPFNSTQI